MKKNLNNFIYYHNSYTNIKNFSKVNIKYLFQLNTIVIEELQSLIFQEGKEYFRRPPHSRVNFETLKLRNLYEINQSPVTEHHQSNNLRTTF